MQDAARRPAESRVLEESLPSRLERGHIEYFPACPFSVPACEDHNFLTEQQLGGRLHKQISYFPARDRVEGFLKKDQSQEDRLRDILVSFSAQAGRWLAGLLPSYGRGWRLHCTSFHPEEEATRRLGLLARKDLLHVDVSTNPPTDGKRILKLFVNFNPHEPRVWATGDCFEELLEKFGTAAGLPSALQVAWSRRLRQGMLRLFQSGPAVASPYDAFMVRLHNHLKRNDAYQERARRKYWSFAPGSAWLGFTDGTSHAELRGRFALEQTYFVPPECLALPDESPAALLERHTGLQNLARAA